jgi:hypothetical protein
MSSLRSFPFDTYKVFKMTGTWAPCLCLLILASAVLSEAADNQQLTLEGDERTASDRRLLQTDDSGEFEGPVYTGQTCYGP